MSSAPLNDRVSVLEAAMADLARAQAKTEAVMQRTEAVVQRTAAEVDRLSVEMREFKDEMREFKDEMRTFRNESRSASAEADRRQGALTNKLGRLVEDIIGPSVPLTFTALFGIETIVLTGIRNRTVHPADPGRTQELDGFAVGGDTFLVVEVKSQLRPEDIVAFTGKLADVRTYWPDLARQRRVVGAVAAFHVDPSLIRAAETAGLFTFGLDRDLIDVLNGPGFVPRSF